MNSRQSIHTCLVFSVFLKYFLVNKGTHNALMGVAQWVAHHHANRKVAGCRPGPWVRSYGKQATDVSLPLLLPPLPSL